MTPPELGLARLRIHGFAGLTPSEQQQAAALALHRDLSVEGDQLRLAARPAEGSTDLALVAFSTRKADTASVPATSLLSAMLPGTAFWVDAPSGYIVSERGAAAVDFASLHDELPAVVVATLSDPSGKKIESCVLVNRDRALIDDDRLQWWTAASGVAMLDGPLPAAEPVPLLERPRARLSPARTRLDRVLLFCAVASVACVAAAALLLANGSTTPPPVLSGNKLLHAQPGALLDRIGTIAPDLVNQAQSATFASGAWVLVLPDALDTETLKRASRALEINGLAVQSVATPSPRIRVQLP